MATLTAVEQSAPVPTAAAAPADVIGSIPAAAEQELADCATLPDEMVHA